MSISSFFQTLRSGYQAEIDDLTFDSDGHDVLRQRLAQRRKELGFLLQMMELSPEMVAVVFHQGFRFRMPAAMDHLISHESEDMPEWDSLSDVVELTPWAAELAQLVRQQAMGDWFMCVAAGLEYMYGKADTSAQQDTPEEEDSDDDQANTDSFDADDDMRDVDPAAREEAGADWLAEQGFDRKD